MAIIINDFEIVPPAPGDQQPAAVGAQPSQQEQAGPPMQPEDIERIVRRFAERKLRLLAD